MLLLLLPESLVALIVLTIAQVSSETTSMSRNADLHRPAIHFTPQYGFMNDPNGLIWDPELGVFHMFYQYNPNGTVAGDPHWGHATSPDLLNWKDESIALGLDQASGAAAFSGSAVWDANNTSGLFSKSSDSNLVAIFTRALPYLQYQAIATSSDHGRAFNTLSERTVLDLNMSQFRDPQVQWYEPEKKWVMVVVLAREHKVAFYESKDLLHWNLLSHFRAGVLGVDYECPNLVQVQAGDRTQWVLFISINPGAPQGGSGTQYFIGNFDGKTFEPDNYAVRFVDFAKDNYALQIVNDVMAPNSPTTYIGWFGNWQYCQEAPTDSWRGAMTLPRAISLAKDVYGDLRLVQQPRGLESLRVESEAFHCKLNIGATDANNQSASGPQHEIALPPKYTAVELLVRGRVDALNEAGKVGAGRIHTRFSNPQGEVLELGFDAATSQMWLDRSALNGFKHPFYTGQFSAALDPGSTTFDWRVVLDASLIEVYAQNGFVVASSVYYADSPLTTLNFSMPHGGSAEVQLTMYPLRKAVDRNTVRDS